MRKIRVIKFTDLLIGIILLLSLNVIAQNNVVGKYIGKETGRTLILKNDESFFLLNKEQSIVFHIDTLSFGSWKRDRDFIVLNTPKSINSSRLKVEVEENCISKSDSLVLEIFNPYENYFEKEGGRRLFDYVIYITSYEENFGTEIYMKGNKISLYKTENNKIVNLSINIIPNSYLYPSNIAFNYLYTDLYLFKNRNSNYIKVTIPQLTLEYIGYVRFKEEHVGIMQNNLLLRGEVFKKDKCWLTLVKPRL